MQMNKQNVLYTQCKSISHTQEGRTDMRYRADELLKHCAE